MILYDSKIIPVNLYPNIHFLLNKYFCCVENNNQEGKSSKKITEMVFQANLLSKMKSYELTNKNLLPKDIEKPSIYKIYHMPRERTKIFWTLPNNYMNIMIEDFMRKKFKDNGDDNESNILKVC